LIVFNVRLNLPKERDFDEQVRMSVWWMQQAIACLPPDKSKFTLLVNRIDSGQGNIDIEIDKAVLTIFQDNFPERMHRCVVYPSGVVFFLLWNIIKFFIDKRTQEKVKTVLYLAGVQEYIDDEFIPAEMGGKSEYKFNVDDFQDPPGLEEPTPTSDDGSKQEDPPVEKEL